MSVQSEITRLETAKSDIATAITNKGVTVPSGTKLDGMAALIGSIASGGGGGGGTQFEVATLTITTTFPASYAGFYQICATRFVNGIIEPFYVLKNPMTDSNPIKELVIENVLINSPIYLSASGTSGIPMFQTNGVEELRRIQLYFVGKIISSNASVILFNAD